MRDANARFDAANVRSTLVHERIEGDRVIEDKREDWVWMPAVDLAHLVCRNWVLNNSVLTRMGAVRQAGYYNEHMPVLGDWDYVLRILTIGDIGSIDRRLSYYHRRSAAAAQCGNSVTSGIETHRLYDVLYRNSLLRSALKDPGELGILHVVLRMMEEHRNALARQMVEHDSAILRAVEDLKGALARQMVEHDTLLLKRMSEGFAQLQAASAPAPMPFSGRLSA